MTYILSINDVEWLTTTSPEEAFSAFKRWVNGESGARVNLRFVRTDQLAA
jgi:hypothetical protein